MNHIFNRSLLKNHRDNASRLIDKHDFLIKLSSDRILEHIADLRPSYKKILDLGARNGFLTQKLMNKYPNSHIEATDISYQMLKSNPAKYKKILDEENMPSDISDFDLITSVLNAHWINDLPKFFKTLKQALNKDGILILSLFASPSLNKLRTHLLQTEISASSISSPHISPFITASDIYKLLQHAGFSFIIVENDNIEVEYDNILSLMKELKAMGESNNLIAAHPILPKAVVKKLSNSPDIFVDSFEIVTLVAR